MTDKKITYQTYYENQQKIEKNWVFFNNDKQLFISSLNDSLPHPFP